MRSTRSGRRATRRLTTGNVSLRTVNGSILDARNNGAGDLHGARSTRPARGARPDVDIDANGGSDRRGRQRPRDRLVARLDVAVRQRELRRHSTTAHSDPGLTNDGADANDDVGLEATENIYLTETEPLPAAACSRTPSTATSGSPSARRRRTRPTRHARRGPLPHQERHGAVRREQHAAAERRRPRRASGACPRARSSPRPATSLLRVGDDVATHQNSRDPRQRQHRHLRRLRRRRRRLRHEHDPARPDRRRLRRHRRRRTAATRSGPARRRRAEPGADRADPDLGQQRHRHLPARRPVRARPRPAGSKTTRAATATSSSGSKTIVRGTRQRRSARRRLPAPRTRTRCDRRTSTKTVHRLVPAVDERRHRPARPRRRRRRRRALADPRRPGRHRLLHDLHDRQPRLASATTSSTSSTRAPPNNGVDELRDLRRRQPRPGLQRLRRRARRRATRPTTSSCCAPIEVHRQREPVRRHDGTASRRPARRRPRRPTVRRSSRCSPATTTPTAALGLYRDRIAGNEPTSEVQRINYDTALNGRLSVFGLGGNDAFFVDDTTRDRRRSTAAPATTCSRSARSSARSATANTEGALLPQDTFPVLIATTRGWLSPGPHAPLVATGGTGNDEFVVYSNQAELRLEGDDDNDLFIVRAFALAAVCDTEHRRRRPAATGTTSTSSPTDDGQLPASTRTTTAICTAADDRGWHAGLSARTTTTTTSATTPTPQMTRDDDCHTTVGGRRHPARPGRPAPASPMIGLGFSIARPLDIRAGGGEDEVQYNVNAPVSVDGGTGFDKLVVLGTEFADDIVITAEGDLRRRPQRPLHDGRGHRGRRARGRRRVLRPVDGVRRRLPRDRRPRLRHDQRHRRRDRGHRHPRARGPDAARSTTA